jgi:hypothetical protein
VPLTGVGVQVPPRTLLEGTTGNRRSHLGDLVTSERSTLELQRSIVTGVFHDGNITRHPESHFLDLVVNGQSLRAVTAAGDELVTELNRPWLPGVPDSIERFLGRRPGEFLAPGRIPLLVCPVDGDLGCGQLTTALDVRGAEVTWSDFRWEDGIVASRPVEHLDQPITFGRAQYEAAFDDAYERVAAFFYDELAHHGRRFLWPWQWGWKLPRD